MKQDSSLKELAAMHNPPITKSGLNGRLQKLLQAADDLEPRKEEEAT